MCAFRNIISKSILALVGVPPRTLDIVTKQRDRLKDNPPETKFGRVVFRDAFQSDLSAIVKLLADDVIGSQREVVSEPPDPKYVAGFREIERQLGNRIIVAADEIDGIVGCFQLTITPGLARHAAQRATIEGVRVRSDKRGTGLGTTMFEYAIESARAAGCALIQLTTDKERPKAQRFYESIGFRPSHVGMKLDLL